MRMDQVTGHVLEIQRMSTEDGPGLRTTLFVKGCPLHCPWCHNPESISTRPQVQWFSEKCIGCCSCIAVCPEHALHADEDGAIRIDQERCTGCGKCADSCPALAMQRIGEFRTAEDVISELLKDLAYFRGTDDGGVTISGGEAAMQAEFVREVFSGVKEAGVSTALDTCGVCTREEMMIAAESADIVLFDLKMSDRDEHRRIVGGDLTAILKNLRTLIEMKKRIWIRTPVIPGYTDSRENVIGLASMVNEILREYGPESVERWELCAFNDLCVDKYRRLGMTWQLAGEGLMTGTEMDALVDAVVSTGFPAQRVRWTGMTQIGDEDNDADV